MKCRKAYQNPEKYNKYRNAYNYRYYKKTQDAPNVHKRWEDDEVELIIAHQMTDHELSAQLGRSVRSIQAKRHKEKTLRENAADEPVEVIEEI